MTDAPAFRPAVGEPPAVQFISTGKLKVDLAYQRTIEGGASQKLIENIARRWDWRLCVPLLVAARGQDLYIIDGQHRWAAAAKRGDIAFLPCAVGQYKDAAEEAALFVAANRRRVAVNRLDLWRAALAGGDQDTVTIDRLLRDAGLSMATNTVRAHLKAGEIITTSVLYKAIKVPGGERKLGATLEMVGRAFGDQLISFSSTIIQGLLLLDIADMDEAQRARLLAVLRRKSADDWATLPAVTRARGAQPRAQQLFFAIGDELAPSKAAVDPPSLARSAAPPTPSAPAQRAAPPSIGGAMRWCDQCDQKVSATQAARCTSAFCKAKAA